MKPFANIKLVVFASLISYLLLGATLAAVQQSTQIQENGTVHIVGSKFLAVNPTYITFGNMSANQRRTLTFNLTNTGGAQLNLTYTQNLGNLPGGSALLLGSCYVGWPMQYNLTQTVCITKSAGLSPILPAGYLEVLTWTLSPGPGAVNGTSYNFGVTITGT